MKKVATSFLLLSFVLMAFSPRLAVYSQKVDDTGSHFVEGEMLVKLKSEVPPIGGPEQVADLVPPGRAAQVERIETSNGGELLLFKFDPHINVRDAVLGAVRDPRVEYAEPNYLLRPAETVP